MRVYLSVLTVVSAVGGVVQAAAQADTEDEPIASIIHPTQKEDWRELSADRPDFTESPYTVDAGAVQVEMSFFDYAKSGDTDSFAVALSNVKVGLLDNTDIQFVISPYINEDTDTDTNDGLGDSQVRLKVNLYGNDTGSTALAIMPFIQVPTAAEGLGHNHVEGGIIIPWATELDKGVGLGLMLEADFVYDDAAKNYRTDFIATAAVGFDVTDDIGAYSELIGVAGLDSDELLILGVGATYTVTPNLQFDAGVNIGLVEAADDVNLFSGMTLRF